MILNQKWLIELKRTANCLSPDELNMLRKHLLAYQNTYGNPDTKSLKLLEILLANENPEETAKKLSAFKDLKNLCYRLQSKITDVLLMDVNIHREGIYDARDKTWADINKKHIKSRILLGRGLQQEAVGLYHHIIKKARQYEWYDILVEVLYKKLLFLNLRISNLSSEKLREEIARAEEARKGVYISNLLYEELGLYEEFKGTSKFKTLYPEYQGKLKNAIAEIEKFYQQTNSVSIAYYLNNLKIEREQLDENYEEAAIYCRYVVEIAMNSAVCTKHQLGLAYLNLAQNYLFMGDLAACIAHAREASGYFKKGSFNYSLSQEVEFYGYFYGSQLEEAEKIMASLYAATRHEVSPYKLSKRTYLFACVYFLKGEYKTSYTLLQHTKEIDKDKEGWNIGIRLLAIMNQVEMENFDEAHNFIVNLRQYIDALKKTRVVKKRDLLIVKVLLQLDKESFQTEKVLQKKQEELHLLDSSDADYKWRVCSSEPIKFHKWIKAIANKKFKKDKQARIKFMLSA